MLLGFKTYSACLFYCFTVSLIFQFFRAIRARVGPGGSCIPGALWIPTDPIKELGHFLNQKSNTNTAVIGLGVYALALVLLWEKEIL